MSMPIQRQSEAYGIFDDGPRFARDRNSTDLPKGLAGLINSTGPRIQAGLLNTRRAGTDSYPTPEHLWEGEGPDRDEDGRPLRNSTPSEVEHFGDAARALREHRIGLNTRQAAGFDFGKGPRDHGGAGPDGGPALPRWYYDDRDSDESDDEDYGDPERYIPEHLIEGRRGSGRLPFDRTAACQQCGVSVFHTNSAGWIHESDDEQEGWERDAEHTPEPEEADELDLDSRPDRGLDSLEAWHEQRRLQQGARTGQAVMDPTQMQAPMGGGYQIGHRVGLPWRGQLLPGTVINLDGPKVNVRWDDGQYSPEEPHNIQLL